MNASGPVGRLCWRGGRLSEGERLVAEEAPVAFSYNGASYAVMLATPADLRDFAVGFSLTEGIVRDPGEIEEVAVVEHGDGIVLRIWVAAHRREALERRRRRLAGPAGCGLCGIESLAEAARLPGRVGAGARFSAEEIGEAVAGLHSHQVLGAQTRAVHAAGLWHRREGMVAVREDVGRHNAVDKLAGAVAGMGVAGEGVLVLTSRVSVELVQKAARMGVGVVAAVSAPTGLAVRTAGAAGITLVGVAREDGFEVFSHWDRVVGGGVGVLAGIGSPERVDGLTGSVTVNHGNDTGLLAL